MKIRYIVVCALMSILSFSGCEDFLSRRPHGQIVDGDQGEMDSDAAMAAGVFKVYSDLKSWGIGVFPWIGISSITSDDADKGSTATDSPDMMQLDDFTFNSYHWMFNDFYSSSYRAITQCNIAIRDLEPLNDMPGVTQLLGEARFLRAYFYFNLTRVFGGMPIIDRVYEQNEKTPPRSSLNETYQFIESDLKFAIDNLPLKSGYAARWAGRATQGAAQGLLAKVFLYQERYSEVLVMTQSVIGSGEYNLNTPYDKIFKEAFENGSESLFEAQCETREGYWGLDSQFAEVQGVRGELDLGWGFNVPSQKLVDAYEPNDPRKAATIIFRGTTLEDGRVIPASAVNSYYNKKAYSWLDEAARHPLFPKGGWINIRLLRYADVVLMHAEAANELGQATDAIEKLEWIRSRARANQSGVLPKITTVNQDELRLAIRNERRIELAMEQERYFDLVRWGIAKQELGNKWVEGKHNLFPIPQSQIDLSNGVLVQNPGY